VAAPALAIVHERYIAFAVVYICIPHRCYGSMAHIGFLPKQPIQAGKIVTIIFLSDKSEICTGRDLK
jgi:hypothetical protein